MWHFSARLFKRPSLSDHPRYSLLLLRIETDVKFMYVISRVGSPEYIRSNSKKCSTFQRANMASRSAQTLRKAKVPDCDYISENSSIG
jgi:hypothetical protein